MRRSTYKLFRRQWRRNLYRRCHKTDERR
ncbi:MAG: hypothetical protein IJ640_12025 [Prevotella sp.]|nr:hypothetical protein [Prevotella sp.]MBR1527363.1 hypothetical protein [Prevotella sp.]